METKQKSSPFYKRIHEIDFLRGFLMVLVIVDHIFNLLMSFNKGWAGGAEVINAGNGVQPFLSIYNVANWYWTFPGRTIIRWIALALFCFVSGISSAFSRNNWKRAIEMLVLWAIIFGGSNLLEFIRSSNNLDFGVRTLRVDFNIIGVLAWSTFIYCFFQKKSWKWLLIIAIIGFILHPICVICSKTDWGNKVYLFPLWNPNPAIADEADYMPLFPYLSFFFLGALLSKFTYEKERKSHFKRFEWEKPICFLGRHSLIVYVTHFIILIGLFSFVGLFIK